MIQPLRPSWPATRTGLIIAILVLVILFALDLMLVSDSQEAPSSSMQPSEWDQHLIELEEEALDAAYKQQIVHLFDNWMKDWGNAQPSRAVTGARHAREAYVNAKNEIKRRKGPGP